MVAERGEPLARALGELGVALDGVDVPGDLGEHGRGIARAGPDLEHVLVALQPERLDHHRDDVRLRDRLARPDRQRAILVGELGQIGRQECLARHRLHRRENGGAANAAEADVAVDHALAL